MEMASSSDKGAASQLALRVALQTMKERCISLQKRLNTVEEENQELRERLDSKTPTPVLTNSAAGSIAENFQLRTQVAELNRQKTLLNEHINMVSTENSKLWSRLSQIVKERKEISSTCLEIEQIAAKYQDCTLNELGARNAHGSSASQNLIRSKTFTQHSPNPNLRHKLLPVLNQSNNTGAGDNSLDEVALGASYEQLSLSAGVDGGGGEGNAAEAATQAELGVFAYMNVDDADLSLDNGDMNEAMKKCLEGLDEMEKQALEQQNELKVILAQMKSRKGTKGCTQCELKSKKPEMADKSLETDESLDEMNLYNAQAEAYKQANVFQQISSQATDKICPMCGKIYDILFPFEQFREHVETHFLGDASDTEPSLERNFEFISHAVGDF